MKKIAIVDGHYMKDAEEPIKKLYINGELQNKIAEFGKKHDIIDVKPINSTMMLITYDDNI